MMTLQRGFEVNVTSSVLATDQDAWNYLAGERPFASYAWYHFCETVLEGCYTPYYITASHQGEPVARSTFWLAPQEPLPVSSRPIRAMLEPIFRRWPLFICRSPLANMSGLILPEPPLRDAAVEALTRSAEAISRQNHASFIIFDYLVQDDHSTNWPPGYAQFSGLDSSTNLYIQWPDFESYLAHLGSSARKDYRRHRNRAADLGIKIAVEPDLKDPQRALELIRNVEVHHQSTHHPATSRVLEYASSMNGNWITAHIDDQMVGCGLLIGNGHYQFLMLLGLDYSVEYVYFQLFYAAIENAIKSGTKVLCGGSGAYEFKKRFGFQLEQNNYLVYRASNRGLRWLAQQFED